MSVHLITWDQDPFGWIVAIGRFQLADATWHPGKVNALILSYRRYSVPSAHGSYQERSSLRLIELEENATISKEGRVSSLGFVINNLAKLNVDVNPIDRHFPYELAHRSYH